MPSLLKTAVFSALLCGLLSIATAAAPGAPPLWQTVTTTGKPHARHEVEALDTRTGTWSLHSLFSRGRHGSGLARLGDTLYVAAGSGRRGGRPELDSLESFPLPLP